jgi:hypothetical protein
MTGRDEFSELISAFLDGEVTPEEQALIEERLVDNAADRRLFEELRSIRDGLRALPRRELGKDLSQSVLRSAERAMLAGEATERSLSQDKRTALQQDAEGREAAIVATPPGPPQRSNWRTLAWAGLGVAAAVVIMVIGTWPAWQRPVAMLPSEEHPEEAAGEPIRLPTSDRAYIAEAEMADEAGAGPAPAPAKGVRESKMALSEAIEEAPASAAPERKADTDFTRGVGDRRLALGGRAKEMPRAEPPVPASPTPRYSQTPETKKPDDGTDDDLIAQNITEELESIDLSTDRLWVVTLDVAPDAVRAHRLDDALADNSVSFEYGDELLHRIRDEFAKGQRRDRWDLDQGASRLAVRELEGRQDQLALAGDQDVMVFAEGPPQQVRAVLKDLLLQQRDEFQLAGVLAGPPTVSWQQFREVDKTKRAPGSAPPGRVLLADADSSAVTDAEGEDADLSTTERLGRTRRTTAEPEPTDAPNDEPPTAALDSSAPAAEERFAGRGGRGRAAPEMPAVVPAEEPPPPAAVPPVDEPLAEALEQPELTEERVAESDGDDEAVVRSAESKPVRPDGVLRKPSEGSAKKYDLFRNVADAERDEKKRLQVKAEGVGGAAAPTSDMKLAGQEAERQRAGAALRKNREDGRLSGDANDSIEPSNEGARPQEENATARVRRGPEAAPAGAAASPDLRGGFGSGTAGRLHSASDEVRDWNRGFGHPGQKKLAEAAQSAEAAQTVRVVFVLRKVARPAGITASPLGNIAADVPADQPPSAAARILHAEADAAAEAAEGVAEPAEPAGRD